MSAEQAESSGSVVSKCRSYVSESIAELKKISHPTRQQTVQATLVTLVIVVFVAFCLFILDVIFGKLMQAII
jgi:preprotein translocase subunit SecE